MRYEWDERKRQSNLVKHGVDFEMIDDAIWSDALALPDRRYDYGEERILAYVPIHGRLHAVLYVQRGKTRRIISLRKANKREQDYVKTYQKR